MPNEIREPPQSGEIWRHFKGGTYVILDVVAWAGDMEEKVVVYSSIEGVRWARFLSEFMDVHPSGALRFERVN